MKFALMWANHTYIDCHPFAPASISATPRSGTAASSSRKAFDLHTADAIKRYFAQPNYWKIEGRPYFSVFDPHKLITGLGGVTATRAALDSFHKRTQGSGFSPDCT